MIPPRSFRSGLKALALALLTVSAASGLDISGTVTDKIGKPLAGAKICLQSAPSRCFTTDSTGAFLFGNPGNTPVTVPRRLPAFRLAGAVLKIHSAAAGEAELAFFDSQGRQLTPWRKQPLPQGPGEIPLDFRGHGGTGPVFARFRGAVRGSLRLFGLETGVWMGASALRGLEAGPPPAAGNRSFATRLGAAGRTGTQVNEALLVQKTGYRQRLYRPYFEMEEDVQIPLALLPDSGALLAKTTSQRVLEIDRTSRFIVRENVLTSCYNVYLVRDTLIDSLNYNLAAGKLHTWENFYCEGFAYTGSSKDVVGAWKAMSGVRQPLPANLKPGDCSPEPVEESEHIVFQSGNYAVAANKLTSTVVNRICPGDLFGEKLIQEIRYEDTTVLLTGNSCLQQTFKSGETGLSAVLNYTVLADSVRMSLAYNGKTCTVHRWPFGKEPVSCPDLSYQAEESFGKCLKSIGFLNPVHAVLKRAAPRGARNQGSR